MKEPPPPPPWVGAISGLAESALRLAGIGTAATRSLNPSPEQLRMMATAGESLRDVRRVTGVTVAEISSALDLRDKSVWEAIEAGREVLSLEAILRLASLLARNDPLPFVLRMARTYQPRLWAVMQQLGMDGLPLQLERERDFINILRRRDEARTLPDAQWSQLLEFTRQAFELGLGMQTAPASRRARSAPKARRSRVSPK